MLKREEMTYGYSTDLREKVIKYIEAGGKKGEASRTFRICRQTIYNWLKLKEEGDYSLKPKGGNRVARKLNYTKLMEYIKENGDAYLYEIGEAFDVSANAIWCACRKLGITRKKRVRYIRKETRRSVRNTES
jgi:transposase